MAKTIPVVGSAFLGSDPLTPRVLKVTYGTATAVVDVEVTNLTTAVTGALYDELVNFSDSGYLITGMKAEIIEAFTADIIEIGQDSEAVQGSVGFFLASNPHADSIGMWDALTLDTLIATDAQDMVGSAWKGDSTASVFSTVTTLETPWPDDSGDTIRAIFDSGAGVATAGKMALYVEYHAL